MAFCSWYGILQVEQTKKAMQWMKLQNAVGTLTAFQISNSISILYCEKEAEAAQPR